MIPWHGSSRHQKSFTHVFGKTHNIYRVLSEEGPHDVFFGPRKDAVGFGLIIVMPSRTVNTTCSTRSSFLTTVLNSCSFCDRKSDSSYKIAHMLLSARITPFAESMLVTRPVPASCASP